MLGVRVSVRVSVRVRVRVSVSVRVSVRVTDLFVQRVELSGLRAQNRYYSFRHLHRAQGVRECECG